MSMAGYTKLFNSILASTIWRANDKTRIVWITLLAMADKDGICEGSVPGLADLSRVSIEDCEAALEELSSPDPYSRTSEHEGRRIETIDGVGWKLLNHAKYRQKMSEDERREYNRRKQAEHRAKQKEEELAMSSDVNECQTTSMTVNDSQSQSAMSAHTEADTEADTDTKAKKKKKSNSENAITRPDIQSNDTWLLWLEKQPKYTALNVKDKYQTMLSWCEKNKQTPSRKRLITWLNKEIQDVPITTQNQIIGCEICLNHPHRHELSVKTGGYIFDPVAQKVTFCICRSKNGTA